MNINGQTDGPLLPLNAVMVFEGDHRRGYVTADGRTWEYYNGRGTTLDSSWHYWEHVSRCPRDWAQPFREVWAEVEAGTHNTSCGRKPDGVIPRCDGTVAVWFEAEDGYDPWATAVRPF